jgi:hypothetical protein
LIFWILSLSTDIALVLSPQAVNSCLGGLGKAKKGLMAHAQKMVKVSATKRLSSKSEDLTFSKKDPNEVQFETNKVLLKNNVRSASEEDGDSVQDLQRIIQELREQRNLDSLSMQEMQSRLEELGEIGGFVKKSSRGTAKRAFTPMDVNKVENPLKGASSGDKDDSNAESLADHERAEISQKPDEDSQLSKKDMIKAKMKERAAEKAAEVL